MNEYDRTLRYLNDIIKTANEIKERLEKIDPEKYINYPGMVKTIKKIEDDIDSVFFVYFEE